MGLLRCTWHTSIVEPLSSGPRYPSVTSPALPSRDLLRLLVCWLAYTPGMYSKVPGTTLVCSPCVCCSGYTTGCVLVAGYIIPRYLVCYKAPAAAAVYHRYIVYSQYLCRYPRPLCYCYCCCNTITTTLYQGMALVCWPPSPFVVSCFRNAPLGMASYLVPCLYIRVFVLLLYSPRNVCVCSSH